MELCEGSQRHPPPPLSACHRSRASVESWLCRLLQALPKIIAFLSSPSLHYNQNRKKNPPKHISHMISREKVNDVMASAGNPVNASRFLSTCKSTVLGLPQAPCSPWHIAQSCCSSFIQQPSSDHASSFPAEKALIKTGRQRYSLAPGIMCA